MNALIAKYLESRLYISISSVFVLAVLIAFLVKVDLTPQFSPEFFFSSDSEIYREDQAIQNKFPFGQHILLNVTTKSITDPNYHDKIETLSNKIKVLEGVESLYSLTHGPDDLEAARENPLWRRMLMGNREKSSFIIAFVARRDHATLVKTIETIAKQEKNKWFSISISGLPYIIEQIRRNLSNDMINFTAATVILSALVLFAVFRSFLLVIGALVTCLTAAMLTLVIQSVIGIPIGILTANLGAIVFVLTQSHLVFLVANWCNAARKSPDVKLKEAIRHTLPASFWAMVTTLLGFASLIFVEAKPLNQLGAGGAIGTFAALLCAYTIFPTFLRMAKVEPSSFTYSLADRFPLPRRVAATFTFITIAAVLAVGIPGISRLNTDPSLLTYFKRDSSLYQGLYHVDENGGSNPLNIVIKREDGKTLDNSESYERMWELQKSIASHKAVGSIISLPVIMAEADEHWLGSLLPWSILVDILSKPEFGGIAQSFINKDRTEALFMLRMQEEGRERDRVKIVEEIKAIPSQHGFKVIMTGGTYYLQGALADSVAKSMIVGIVTLLTLFFTITFFIAGSVIVALNLIMCAGAIAAIVLGTIGLLGIPVDIISSPSVNIFLGLIVDNMIHLTVAAKRHAGKIEAQTMRQWDVWKEALDLQSWPALVSTITIMIGFSVFALSDFPPSQRFGLEIVGGAGLAVLLALVVFPYTVSRRWRKAAKYE